MKPKEFMKEVIKAFTNASASVSEMNKAFADVSKVASIAAAEIQDSDRRMKTAIKDYRRMLKVKEAESLHARGHYLRHLIIEYEFQF